MFSIFLHSSPNNKQKEESSKSFESQMQVQKIEHKVVSCWITLQSLSQTSTVTSSIRPAISLFVCSFSLTSWRVVLIRLRSWKFVKHFQQLSLIKLFASSHFVALVVASFALEGYFCFLPWRREQELLMED